MGELSYVLQVDVDSGYPINNTVNSCLDYLYEHKIHYDLVCDAQHSEIPVIPIANRNIARSYLPKNFKEVEDYPQCLSNFTNRYIFKTTLGEVYQSYEYQPGFIKPVERKLFKALWVSKSSDLIPLSGFLKSTEVYKCVTKVNFLSEYRCLVIADKLAGMDRYRGDPFLVPSKKTVEHMINCMKSKKLAAYALDVGVIRPYYDESQLLTTLVEVNDCVSLGHYSRDVSKYIKAVTTRWQQIYSQK